MWGEAASDLWGHLEWEEHDREVDTLEGKREPLEGDVKPTERRISRSGRPVWTQAKAAAFRS